MSFTYLFHKPQYTQTLVTSQYPHHKPSPNSTTPFMPHLNIDSHNRNIIPTKFIHTRAEHSPKYPTNTDTNTDIHTHTNAYMHVHK